MSYLVMARKYRPQRFEDVVDQHHVTRTLRNAIENHRMAHAILLTGPRGTGKTTVARILAKAMNCADGPTPDPCNQCSSCVQITAGNAVDVYEIDGASNNSVDQIRELRDNIQYMPAHGSYKIYIIDEVHMLSTAAFNALLKTLEEPPAHVMFIFATTEPQKIPVTILSRCQRHDFRRIDLGAIQTHLLALCGREGIVADTESLFLIAREAGGSMRDALSLLDQVISCSRGQIDETLVHDVLGVIDRKLLIDLSGAILAGDAGAFLDALEGVYERGQDIRKLYADLLEYFRNLLVVRLGRDAGGLRHYPPGELELLTAQAETVPMPVLNQVLQEMFRGEPSVRLAPQPRMAMEMVVLRLIRSKPSLPIEALIEQIEKLRGELGRPATRRPSTNSSDGDIDVSPGGAEKQPAAPARENTGKVAVPPKTVPGMTEGPVDPDILHGIREAVAERSSPLGAALSLADMNIQAGEGLEILIPGNGFQVQMVQRKKNMQVLEEVITVFFGREMKITVRSQAGACEDPGARKEHENRIRKEALNHPVVADVLDIFNGRITDVKS